MKDEVVDILNVSPSLVERLPSRRISRVVSCCKFKDKSRPPVSKTKRVE